jgi:hypothetical protein
MQLNILHGLMKIFTFFELSTFLHESNHFELIETTIQTLHLAFTSLY